MMKTFRQFLFEAEKSEFIEKHLPPTHYRNSWHLVTHNKKIGNHSVNNILSGADGHYDHSFSVDGIMKRDNVGAKNGGSIFSHVRDVASSFIKHYTPKSLTYSAVDDNFNHMYSKLGHHLAKKHGGEYNYEEETGSHMIFFKKNQT